MRVERALVGILCVAAATATGCGGGKLAYNLPPAARLMEPGPGVGGPGPGVIPPAGGPYGGMYGGGINRFGAAGMGGAMGGPYANGQMPMGPGPGTYAGMGTSGQLGNDVMQASFNEQGVVHCEGGACALKPGMHPGGMNDPQIMQAGFHGHGLLHRGAPCHIRPGSVESYGGGADGAFGVATTQVAFLGDEGVQVSWDVSGSGMFDSDPLVVPGRQDFYQGAIYRLRLSNIPGRPGIELFPTLEIAPVTPRTDAYLAHSPVPVQFTEEDFDQVTSGNFVTKVIYLPDPEFQELALAGVETLVSTRLDPGVDPIVEADRRGSILAILRMGNKDLRRVGMNVEYESEVVPASHSTSIQKSTGWDDVRHASASEADQADYESQALYHEELDAAGMPTENGVTPAQYCGPYGAGYGDGSMGGMPMGMPTGGFAPPAVPPNMIAGGPQYGMPITGTPIGLPGPPHIPLGVPAGLQKHTMKNKTRVMIPPPVTHMHMTVKQRPGLNYPRPVNHVHVNETQREPFRLLPGWMSGMFGGAHGSAQAGGGYGPDCQ